MRLHTQLCAVLLIGLFPLSACGTLGTDDGGADNLPFRGIGPYTALEGGEDAQGSWFLSSESPEVSYLEPAAVVGQGTIDLYVVEETEKIGDSERVLVRFVLKDDLAPAEPRVVLEKDSLPEWTEGLFSSPALAQHGDQLFLAVEGGERGGIVFFEEKEDGTFALTEEIEAIVPSDVPEEAGGIGSPAIVWYHGDLRLLYTAEDNAGVARIREARWSDGAWKRVGTVLSPGVDCVDPDGESIECWDSGGALDADVHLAYSESGDEVLRLFYAGHSGKKMSLGFAASYGEGAFSKAVINPVIGGSKDFRHPASVFYQGRYLLFYEERVTGGRHGVGLAEASGGQPSEVF